MRTYADYEIAQVEPGADGTDIIVCLLCSDDDESVAWDIGFEMEFDEHLYEYHNLEMGHSGDWHQKTRVWRTGS